MGTMPESVIILWEQVLCRLCGGEAINDQHRGSTINNFVNPPQIHILLIFFGGKAIDMERISSQLSLSRGGSTIGNHLSNVQWLQCSDYGPENWDLCAPQISVRSTGWPLVYYKLDSHVWPQIPLAWLYSSRVQGGQLLHFTYNFKTWSRTLHL